MIAPTARYMIVCRNWNPEADDPNRIDVLGIMTAIRPVTGETFPILAPQICIVLVLSSVRGKGIGQVVFVDDETDLPIFGSASHVIDMPNRPLDIRLLVFRIQDCVIRKPKMYRVQFRYNGNVVEEKYLEVKEALQ